MDQAEDISFVKVGKTMEGLKPSPSSTAIASLKSEVLFSFFFFYGYGFILTFSRKSSDCFFF